MSLLNRCDLHEYQERAVALLGDNRSRALWLPMGLGKSVVTLTHILDRKYDQGLRTKVLVVAPKLVAETVWTAEVQRWAHLRDLKVVFLGGNSRAERLDIEADVYTLCVNNLPWLEKHCGKHWPFDVVVLDESAYFKSPSGVWFRCMSRIARSGCQIIELTGTPSPHSLLDIWSQMYLLDRGERLGTSMWQYKTTHFRPAKTIRVKGREIVTRWAPIDPEDIYSRVADVAMSLRDRDWLDLPEQVNVRVKVPIPKEAYNEMADELVLRFEAGRAMSASAGVAFNKLMQICNGAVYLDDGRHQLVHDRKLEALKGIIETATSPVLVFTAFQHDVVRLLHFIRGSKEVKYHLDEWNRGELPVAVGHPASVGHGLNLQSGGNTIVWFGIPTNLAWYLQGNARLVRQGQQAGRVIIHHLIAENTVEEDVYEALQAKDVTQAALLEAVRARI